MAVPNGYKPRIVDGVIERFLRVFGGVQINGAKWCGKTWTARAHAKSEVSLDDDAILESARIDKNILLYGDCPHLIDEWQLLPEVRDAVRREIDKRASEPGQFILTGSSTPPVETYAHSGAGRIVNLTMRPMSLCEQGISDGTVSLRALFAGEFLTGRAENNSLQGIAQWVCRGGWPAAVDLPIEDALLISRSYMQSFITDNSLRYGISQERFRRFLGSLARNNGAAASMRTLSADTDQAVPFAGGSHTAKGKQSVASVQSRQGKRTKELAQGTIANYLDRTQNQYLIEMLGGWAPALKAKERLRSTPKRYFVDPSLVVAMLNLNPQRLIGEIQHLGILFENLCLRDLRIYAGGVELGTEPSMYYYRDNNGLEADVIIELSDGRWGAVEIKLGMNKADEAAESLLKLRQIVRANPQSQLPDPSFLMVLVGVGQYALQRSDGVCIVPVNLLGP